MACAHQVCILQSKYGDAQELEEMMRDYCEMHSQRTFILAHVWLQRCKRMVTDTSTDLNTVIKQLNEL